MNLLLRTRIASTLLAAVASFACSPSADASLNKLSTPLAGIQDEAYREYDLTVDDIKDSMEFLGQIQVGEPDSYYVYIQIVTGDVHTLDDIRPYFNEPPMRTWNGAWQLAGCPKLPC